jgi:ABC-type polysaccharide/polyol phosphate export permease
MRIRIQTDTGEIPFLAFMLSGLMPWFALQDGVLRGASSIIERRQIIKKVMFPSELFPLSSVMSSLIHHGVGIILFLSGFFVWRGDVSIFQLFSIGALLSVQILLTSGLSLLFSSLSVYLRDLTHVLGVAFQLAFYMTTILYPITAVPQRLKIFVLLNPFTPLTEAYHSVILYNRNPDTGQLIYLACTTAVVFLSGIYVFRKLKKGFADVL